MIDPVLEQKIDSLAEWQKDHQLFDTSFQESILKEHQDVREALKVSNDITADYHEKLNTKIDQLNDLIVANTKLTAETAGRMKYLSGLSIFAEGLEKIGPGWRYALGTAATLSAIYFWGKIILVTIINLILRR